MKKGEKSGQRKRPKQETPTAAPRLPSSVWKGFASLAFSFDDFLQLLGMPFLVILRIDATKRFSHLKAALLILCGEFKRMASRGVR